MAADKPILPSELDAGYPALPADALPGWRASATGGWGRRVSGRRSRSIGCSDSRSAPETVFDAGPGELFVIRNIAGLVPVYEPDDRYHGASAALEYAVLALGVRHIVVLGHGRCGGIEAALDPSGPLSTTDFVGTWVGGVRELAAELDRDDWPDPDVRRRTLELRSVERSIANLRTFPWIDAREREGSLELHGAWFDIALGELAALTPTGWAPVA